MRLPKGILPNLIAIGILIPAVIIDTLEGGALAAGAVAFELLALAFNIYMIRWWGWKATWARVRKYPPQDEDPWGGVQARLAMYGGEIEKRAWQLLFDEMSPSEKGEFVRTGCFTVQGSDGYPYKISQRGSSNVELVGHGKFYCGLPVDPDGYQLPKGDMLLAQKLLIENDIAYFRRVAYVSTY